MQNKNFGSAPLPTPAGPVCQSAPTLHGNADGCCVMAHKNSLKNRSHMSSPSEACYHCIALTDTNRDAKLVPGHSVVTQQFCLKAHRLIQWHHVFYYVFVAKRIGWAVWFAVALEILKPKNERPKEQRTIINLHCS